MLRILTCVCPTLPIPSRGSVSRYKPLWDTLALQPEGDWIAVNSTDVSTSIATLKARASALRTSAWRATQRKLQIVEEPLEGVDHLFIRFVTPAGPTKAIHKKATKPSPKTTHQRGQRDPVEIRSAIESMLARLLVANDPAGPTTFLPDEFEALDLGFDPAKYLDYMEVVALTAKEKCGSGWRVDMDLVGETLYCRLLPAT
jgi:hypothetical protein